MRRKINSFNLELITVLELLTKASLTLWSQQWLRFVGRHCDGGEQGFFLCFVVVVAFF